MSDHPDFATMTPAQIEAWVDAHPGGLFTLLGQPGASDIVLRPISLYGEADATVEVTIRMSPAALRHIDMATTAMPGDGRGGFIRFAVDQQIRAALTADAGEEQAWPA